MSIKVAEYIRGYVQSQNMTLTGVDTCPLTACLPLACKYRIRRYSCSDAWIDFPSDWLHSDRISYGPRLLAERGKAGIPRRRHRHRHTREDPRRNVGPARFPEVIPVASWTTRRHSCDDPHEDVGEDVGVGVRVGVVECQLNGSAYPTSCVCMCVGSRGVGMQLATGIQLVDKCRHNYTKFYQISIQRGEIIAIWSSEIVIVKLQCVSERQYDDWQHVRLNSKFRRKLIAMSNRKINARNYNFFCCPKNLVKIGPVDSEISWLEIGPLKIKRNKS